MPDNQRQTSQGDDVQEPEQPSKKRIPWRALWVGASTATRIAIGIGIIVMLALVYTAVRNINISPSFIFDGGSGGNGDHTVQPIEGDVQSPDGTVQPLPSNGNADGITVQPIPDGNNTSTAPKPTVKPLE